MATPYVQHSHAAMVVFNISVGAYAVAELAQALRWRRGASRANVAAELVFRLIFFGGILMLPFGRALVPGADIGGVALFGLGALVWWIGLLLRWWSFVTLGSYFTTVVKTTADQRVVDRGPYRVLRHPSYTGLLLASFGCGLMLGNWISAAGSFLVILASLVYRLLGEERAMTSAVGDSYLNFANGRARLIPFIW